MIRSLAPVCRRPGSTWSEFSAHWSGRHAAIAARVPQLARYVQAHADPLLQIQPGDIDGCASAWFETREDLDRMRADPVYRTEAVPDELRFLDRGRMAAVLMEMVDGPGPGPLAPGRGVLVMRLVRRAPGLSLGEFASAWPAGLSIPDELPVSGFSVSTALALEAGVSDPDPGVTGFDGLLELWFADAQAVVADPENRAVLRKLGVSAAVDPGSTILLVARERQFVSAVDH